MFDGFTAADFDAYLPDKWGSNMFTLPRRKVRDKLDAVGKALLPVIEAAGLRLGAHLSDDHPSLWNNKKVDTQWLFFSRDEAAQRELAEVIDVERTLAATLADPTPLYRHAFLGVAVRAEALDIGLWLHNDAWVDRRNLVSLLADAGGRARFEALRSALPNEFEIGLAGGELVRAADLDGQRLDAILRDFEEKKGWVFAGARLPREAVIGLGADVLAYATELFGRLAALYAYAAWSPANDAVSIGGVVAKQRQVLEAAGAEAEHERLEREARRREQEEERQRLRAEAEERARTEQAWRERERAIRRSLARSAAATEEQPAPAAPAPVTPTPSVEADAAPQLQAPPKERPPAPPPRREPPREPAPVKITAERMADVRVGDSVVVLKGFLKGRGGVVHSVDEKGDLKVAFGSLTARVPREDVEGRGPQAPQGDGGRRSGRHGIG
jgi:transcription antitermination factor NusG